MANLTIGIRTVQTEPRWPVWGGVLNMCWGVTCKQGYFKITHRNGRTLKGRVEHNTT
jgi:hypothetical protein